jgi:hypothetical protein
VSDAVATALSSAGFTVEGDLGYGIGPYGQEGFGD